MDLNDRYTKGFTAGVAAGIAHVIIEQISVALNISKLSHMDWAGIIFFGSKPHSLLEYIVAIFAHTVFSGILGLLFAYVILKVTSRNYIFKCATLGLIVWFTLYSIIFVFKLNKLTISSVATPASDAVVSFIFGILFALFYKWLDRTERIKS